MRILFTVRRIYFDAIREGTKTREVRRASSYWSAIAWRAQAAIEAGFAVVGTFQCGPVVHRRMILAVRRYENARDALGRDPSPQGRLDLGDGAVFGFDLGKEAPLTAGD